MVALKRSFGARAWSACLEESLEAKEPVVFHTHGYLLWTDGIGVYCRSLDAFKFQDISPRIDVCTVRLRALHTPLLCMALGT